MVAGVRVSVECGGYAEAAGMCQTANHIAALLSESLARKLEAYAGMAGDDATSSEFAASYDPAARDALATLSDLTHALIGLGRLIDASGRNHSAAEAASGGLATNVYSGGGLDEDSFARVAPLSPHSSLGGRTASELGDIQDWILDQVEGFIWPGADVDRLRDAAAIWRRTSASVFDLTAHLDIVGSLLERQRSGEIPLALAAISELRGLVVTTSEELTELATACDDYATAVDDTRERTRSLLAEVGRMIVEETVVTVIVAGLTGGLGGTAKAGAAVLRIRAQAPRFHALLTSLRAVIAGASVRLRAAEDSLQRARAGFERYARASVRDERGELRNPLGWRLERRARLDRIAGTVADPRLFDPQDLRGVSADDLRSLLREWPTRSAKNGTGTVFEDPWHRGRQIRIMEGYPGNRPDALTHGAYAVVSQNGPPTKIPLKGNPTL